MKEIISRLHENRQIELAKSILEAAGYKVEKLKEAEDVQYGVHQFSTGSIIFRGTEEECIQYIDKRRNLWNDAEVYEMTPDDPHYMKESILNEERKQGAIKKIIASLQEKYPECEVKYNNYHNCIDVIYEGDIQFQVYADRVPQEETTYRYEKIDNIEDIKPGDTVYRRVAKKGMRYSYDANHTTTKAIAQVDET